MAIFSAQSYIMAKKIGLILFWAMIAWVLYGIFVLGYVQ